MPGPLFREGELVELRTVEPEDVEFLQRWVNHPDVRAGIATTHPINRPEEEEWVESLGDGDGASFLVAVDGEPVGTVGFSEVNYAWSTTEVGYWVAPDRQGNGYATDATRETVDYAFDELGLAKVSAHALAHNEASRRVLEKVGFTQEGVLRGEAFVDGERVDLVRYGLLADDREG